MINSHGGQVSIEEVAREAAATLRPELAVGYGEAQRDAPARAGLYAFHASRASLEALGVVGDVPALYVGKAESSLHGRDIRQHFETGRTGWSTLRRSLAGCLKTRLDLNGMPRKPEKPGRFSNYGLVPEGDERLTRWMQSELRMAWWEQRDGNFLLKDVEKLVIRLLDPPLNIDHAPTPRRGLRDARARLAAEAMDWASRPPACAPAT